MDDSIKILKTVKLDIGTIELRSDDILFFKPAADLEVYTLETLKQMIKEFIKITEGKPRLYLCDNSRINSNIGPSEKEFVKNHTSDFATAFAMIENSGLLRFLVHSYNHLYKPEIPVKMFKTKEKAIFWLKSL